MTRAANLAGVLGTACTMSTADTSGPACPDYTRLLIQVLADDGTQQDHAQAHQRTLRGQGRQVRTPPVPVHPGLVAQAVQSQAQGSLEGLGHQHA